MEKYTLPKKYHRKQVHQVWENMPVPCLIQDALSTICCRAEGWVAHCPHGLEDHERHLQGDGAQFHQAWMPHKTKANPNTSSTHMQHMCNTCACSRPSFHSTWKMLLLKSSCKAGAARSKEWMPPCSGKAPGQRGAGSPRRPSASSAAWAADADAGTCPFCTSCFNIFPDTPSVT